MPVQFIGAIGSSNASESNPGNGKVIDKVYLGASVRVHEAAGFDRVLVGYFSSAPDGFQLIAYAAQQTQKLNFLLAHRPGFIAPTVVARNLASLDQLIDGRLAVHIISGGSDVEQQRDGDFLNKAQRYARTDDFLDVVKKSWLEPAPFDHDGPYYKVRESYSAVRPAQEPHLPVYFGGSSDEAIEVAGKHADVFALWGETLEQTAETIAKVRAAAARYGREDRIGFSLSLRPVLGRTEEEAWARADRILEAAKARVAGAGNRLAIFRNTDGSIPNVGSRRLVEAARGGRVRDKRLWTELAALTGGSGNSTGLVGTGAQIAESLLDYYDLGITSFLIRGFDPLEDAIAYGREIIPLVRAAVAERDAAREAA